jgi:hypothetical protein
VVLTPSEFQRKLIQAALSHNDALLRNYPLTPDLVAAGVQPRPIELLQWGCSNRVGMLRTFSLEEARFCLLPRAAATVTACGISFKGLHFVSEVAVQAAWFEQARRCGDWKIEVAYHPHLVDRIFVVPTKETPGFECKLTRADNRFAGWTWAEVDSWRQPQKEAIQTTTTQQFHLPQSESHSLKQMKNSFTLHDAGKKRGRASRCEKANGIRGVALNERIISLLLRGIDRHFGCRNGVSLREAYKRTLTEHFLGGLEMIGGMWVPILKPEHERPTFWQFRYVYYTRRKGLS